MAELRSEKYVNNLPVTLVANTVYYVKSGSSVDVYVTNDSGTIVAYPASSNGVASSNIDGGNANSNSLLNIDGGNA
jgi:hypothetical protein